MGKDSGIAWTDDTFSPWHGCLEVSAECDHCYAREFNARFGGDNWGKTAPRRFFGDKHWNEPLKWDRAAARTGKRRLVFCSSMADVFEHYDDGSGIDILDPWRLKLWDLISNTPHLTWLLLTKRPQNIRRMFPSSLLGHPQVWFGTTVGLPSSMYRADALIKNCPEAPVRFVSMEPLLERTSMAGRLGSDLVNWVIYGSESGDGARSTDSNWFRLLRDECIGSRVPQFFKQADEGSDGVTQELRDVPPSRLLPERAAYRKRDLRTGPDGMKRVHWIVERPYLDGVQYIQHPEAA